MPGRHNYRALQAFEAVSRHLSISKAASELGVTQSAISHQIRLLSTTLGERLLRKDGRGVALTPAGEKLAKRLQSAFTEIDRSVAEVIGVGRDTVRLAICSSFAPGWLVPRLHRFYKAANGYDLQLCMYARDPVLADAVADAFITTFPQESGFFQVLLKRESLVAAVPADRVADFGDKLPLITTDLMDGRQGADWKTWSTLMETDFTPPANRWLFASHYVVALEMVRAGLGAALVPDFLVESDVEAGAISIVGDKALATHQDYYLCVKQSRRNEPALDSLIRWFKSEVGRSSGTGARNGATNT